MPIKKISDAPANIRELDDVKLTLAQINKILEIYDALKAQKKVKNPMAVAIAQFKKSYHVSGSKWVKNKEEATAMSAVDLEHLDRYVVVQVDGQPVLAEVADLRELEGDFGHGVYPLWSDELQSIVAFAFEPVFFNAAEAQEWVAKAMEKQPAEMSVMDVLQGIVAPLTRALGSMLGGRGEDGTPGATGLRSFEDTNRLVRQVLEDRYRDPPGPGIQEANIAGPWIIEIGPSTAIVEMDGQMYSIAYTIGEEDSVTLGELRPIEKQWIREDGTPVYLHSFAVHMKAGDEADDEDDGLIWKEIIHPGKWFKTDTGRAMEITADIIKGAFKAWKAGLPKYISVPADSHHGISDGIVPPQANRGFVEKLKLVKDRLFAGFRFTDPEIGQGVQLGNIADVSVFLRPNVTHPETGKQFLWTLQHVLLTNDPLVQDLEPFGVAASAEAGREFVVQMYRQATDEEVNEMAEDTRQEGGQPEGLTLSAEEADVYQQFQGLGLSAEEVKTLIAGREQVRQKGRDLEITQIVRALEGSEEHGGVVQVEGSRHWPVVCVAVEKALREQPEALALAADDEGRTGLDAVVLEIVNALPAESRMVLQAQPMGSKDPADPLADGEDEEPSEEQITELAGRLTPRRGMAISVPQ